MKTINPADASFYCPITGELFEDPYIDHEGNTYEKTAIIEWLKKNGTSPITRNPLTVEQLSPNRAVKDLIASSTPVVVLMAEEEEKKEDDKTPPAPDVSLKASLGSDGCALVKVCVEDDATLRHTGTSVICVIDVSFSMDSPATMHGDSEGSAGLSLLDVVKHATRTVIETLGPSDQLAIIEYADSATTVLPLTNMTTANKKAANQAVTSLRTRGSTNLWDGLLKAMDLAKQQRVPDANIFLLTDGLPNIHPPRGELPSLVRYKERNPEMRCRISTFGFGYSLDSKLLNEIAIAGQGHYGFIPDSSFVGTVFINAGANVLSTAVPYATLSIELLNGSNLADKDFESCRNVTRTSWGISMALPSLSYGQTFEVAFKLDKQSLKGQTLAPFQASLALPGDSRKVSAMTSAITRELVVAPNVRAALIAVIRQSEERLSKAQKVGRKEVDDALLLAKQDLNVLLESIGHISKSCSEDKDLAAMKQDIEGQILEAYSRLDWHQKWGRHFCLSLARAHELQRCTNFKDPGLQVYTTQKFSILRDQGEDIFCKLPPPKPSLARDDDPNFRPIRNMSRYHNSSTPCFAAGSVRLADDRYVPVSQVRAGDKVRTDRGTATVVCVVATTCKNGTQELVELDGGVLVTPWHPVRNKGSIAWKFPEILGHKKSYSCDVVYSFVLDKGASFMQIGSFEAVALGHGITNDNVARHEYLGTSKVIDDLRQMIGWSQGFIKLGPNPGIRDPESGLIVAFEQDFSTDEATHTAHEAQPYHNSIGTLNPITAKSIQA